jgi:hypothetical protein
MAILVSCRCASESELFCLSSSSLVIPYSAYIPADIPRSPTRRESFKTIAFSLHIRHSHEVSAPTLPGIGFKHLWHLGIASPFVHFRNRARAFLETPQAIPNREHFSHADTTDHYFLSFTGNRMSCLFNIAQYSQLAQMRLKPSWRDSQSGSS